MFGFGDGLTNAVFGLILMTDDIDSMSEYREQLILALNEEVEAGRITGLLPYSK